MPNDTEAYPEDSLENMAAVAKHYKYPFPYLIDASQEVAKSYGAVCTPDFYG
jgi:peroxiredoxin